MFTKGELSVISRALTGYKNDLKKAVEAIKEIQVEGDDELLEIYNRRIKEAQRIHSKAMEIRWHKVHNKGVE